MVRTNHNNTIKFIFDFYGSVVSVSSQNWAIYKESFLGIGHRVFIYAYKVFPGRKHEETGEGPKYLRALVEVAQIWLIVNIASFMARVGE
jgi:hypothetical protein